MLLSRLAETVFWFGRYIERAEDMARAISAHDRLCLDMPVDWSPGWAPLMSLCGEVCPRAVDAAVSEQEGVLRFLITDQGNHSSVLSIMTQAREDLRMSRPIVPKETWHTLNAAYLSLREVSCAPSPVALTAVLNEVVAACQQVSAQIAAMMTHDDAYAFVRIGRYLERAQMLLRITTIANAFDLEDAPRPFADVRWMALLKSLGAYQMYRRNNHGRVDAARAMSFLLADIRFPRSLNHCILQIERQLQSLPNGSALQATCDGCKVDSVCDDTSRGRSYAEVRLARVEDLAAAIESSYFR
jgi:uncharacterized alpha-E superfamily protein